MRSLSCENHSKSETQKRNRDDFHAASAARIMHKQGMVLQIAGRDRRAKEKASIRDAAREGTTFSPAVKSSLFSTGTAGSRALPFPPTEPLIFFSSLFHSEVVESPACHG